MLWSWEGPLGTPLGLVQWKRASSPVEAGTSGFLCISDSDARVPAELGQERQASSCVEAWNSACHSSCSWGDRPLVELYLESVDEGVSKDQHSCILKERMESRDE